MAAALCRPAFPPASPRRGLSSATRPAPWQWPGAGRWPSLNHHDSDDDGGWPTVCTAAPLPASASARSHVVRVTLAPDRSLRVPGRACRGPDLPRRGTATAEQCGRAQVGRHLCTFTRAGPGCCSESWMAWRRTRRRRAGRGGHGGGGGGGGGLGGAVGDSSGRGGRGAATGALAARLGRLHHWQATMHGGRRLIRVGGQGRGDPQPGLPGHLQPRLGPGVQVRQVNLIVPVKPFDSEWLPSIRVMI